MQQVFSFQIVKELCLALSARKILVTMGLSGIFALDMTSNRHRKYRNRSKSSEILIAAQPQDWLARFLRSLHF